jgi:hypothetical protein
MEAVPTLLSAASSARYRDGRYGFFRFPRLPPGLPPVAVDFGGFVAARRGGFDYVALQYVQWLRQLDVAWAATFNFPCERELGLNASEQQAATARYAEWFLEHWPEERFPWVITVQDYTVGDYVRHAEELAPLIFKLRHWTYNRASYDLDEPAVLNRWQEQFRVGIGSLCRRNSVRHIGLIVDAVASVLEGIPLHLWGVKVAFLSQQVSLHPQVVSVGSAAGNGRFGRGLERYRASGLSQREYLHRVQLPRYRRDVAAALAAPKHLPLLPTRRLAVGRDLTRNHQRLSDRPSHPILDCPKPRRRRRMPCA